MRGTDTCLCLDSSEEATRSIGERISKQVFRNFLPFRTIRYLLRMARLAYIFVANAQGFHDYMRADVVCRLPVILGKTDTNLRRLLRP